MLVLENRTIASLDQRGTRLQAYKFKCWSNVDTISLATDPQSRSSTIFQNSYKLNVIRDQPPRKCKENYPQFVY